MCQRRTGRWWAVGSATCRGATSCTKISAEPRLFQESMRSVGSCITSSAWLRQPTLLPPMILALGLLVAPYFIIMPGMGAGIAGAKTPQPNVTRLKSIVGHSVFGLGMYVTALMIEAGVGHIPAALAGWSN